MAEKEKDCFQWNVRLLPNALMKEELDRLISYYRFCWNELLAIKKEYEAKKQYDYDLLKDYRPIRNLSEWQIKLPQYILNQAHRRLIKTSIRVAKYNKEVKKYNATHGKKKRYIFMNFKSKKRSSGNQSFTIDNLTISAKSYRPKGKNFTFGIDLSRYSRVPKKYRMMQITELPPGLLDGTAKVLNAVIFKRYDEYYVSFCMERLIPEIKLPEAKHKLIGIDPGVAYIMTLSNRKQYKYLQKLKRLEEKARYYQSRMGKRRKKNSDKQSNRYYDAKTKYSRTLKRIAHLKNDWLHKITSSIAKRYKEIHWEDCVPSRMVRFSNQARYIEESSWGTLSKLLKYKVLKHVNGVFVNISSNRAASQTCFKCGNQKTGADKLTLSDRVFICSICGYSEDRDINAAKNIAKFN